MLQNQIVSIKGVSRTHVVRPTPDQIQELADRYDLHDLIVEDVEDARVQDKIDMYDDHTFIVLHFPKYDTVKKRYFGNEFNIIMGKDYIVSFTSYETSHIAAIRHEFNEDIERMEKSEKFKASPYFVLYTMIDVMYDKMMSALIKFQRDLGILEDGIFGDKGLQTSLLEELLIKRRNSTMLKHMLFPQKEILTELHTMTEKLYGGELDVYFEDLEYKLDKVLGMIAIVNETTVSLSETYGSLASVQTNQVVSVLTIYTVVIGLMTLITGFYGMNVALPGQGNHSVVRLIIIVM
ncbi:MAG: magnesium transporter CorA family protein [Candidatus Peribacteria bacterium]|nr:MAG: magnesium transporter CorA family protein [Candidatus Peribacteria bacterium]